jgi:DNA-binding MarR family transcriptional regulator
MAKPKGWKGNKKGHQIASKMGWIKRKKLALRADILFPHEIQILSILKSANVPLKVSDIARYGHMAPETTKRYLKMLKAKNRVESKKVGGRVYWRLK